MYWRCFETQKEVRSRTFPSRSSSTICCTCCKLINSSLKDRFSCIMSSSADVRAFVYVCHDTRSLHFAVTIGSSPLSLANHQISDPTRILYSLLSYLKEIWDVQIYCQGKMVFEWDLLSKSPERILFVMGGWNVLGATIKETELEPWHVPTIPHILAEVQHTWHIVFP